MAPAAVTQTTIDPTRFPLVVKILIGAGLLLALNEYAPGIPEAVLVLVAVYLVTTHAAEVSAAVAGSLAGFDRALQGPPDVQDTGDRRNR